ncbi:DinB family protein [Streptomyces sp. NPDC014991]|uniref:DinB family protein n=1 Tax=Streptomyces sp. NPDC014991 TaxID=3364935 RepID=UPI00370021A7
MSEYTRSTPSRTADERTSLTGFLDYQRETLAMKCSGLTAGQLRQKAVPPSAISLLGLVRHLAEVERWWFRNVINGEQTPGYWGRRPDVAEFDVDEADPDEAFDVWNAACARSRDIVGGAESLDVVGRHGDEEFSLRYVLTHMIEEYARHNGHADLLRERIDGTTGE